MVTASKTKKTPGQLCFVQKEERKDITTAVREFIANQAHNKKFNSFFSRPGKTNYNIKLSGLWLNDDERYELAMHLKERFPYFVVVFNMNANKMHPYSRFWAGTQVRFLQTQEEYNRFCELERIRGINGIPVVDLPASDPVAPEDVKGVPVAESSTHIAFADDDAECIASMMGDITEDELDLIQQLRNAKSDLAKLAAAKREVIDISDNKISYKLMKQINDHAEKITERWDSVGVTLKF